MSTILQQLGFSSDAATQEQVFAMLEEPFGLISHLLARLGLG